ncbi:MAG: hypothetical protein WC997_02255 [Porticoccaceae bacterium]
MKTQIAHELQKEILKQAEIYQEKAALAAVNYARSGSAGAHQEFAMAEAIETTLRSVHKLVCS